MIILYILSIDVHSFCSKTYAQGAKTADNVDSTTSVSKKLKNCHSSLSTTIWFPGSAWERACSRWRSARSVKKFRKFRSLLAFGFLEESIEIDVSFLMLPVFDNPISEAAMTRNKQQATSNKVPRVACRVVRNTKSHGVGY